MQIHLSPYILQLPNFRKFYYIPNVYKFALISILRGLVAYINKSSLYILILCLNCVYLKLVGLIYPYEQILNYILVTNKILDILLRTNTKYFKLLIIIFFFLNQNSK